MLRIRRVLWAPLALCAIPLVSACGSDDTEDNYGGYGGGSGGATGGSGGATGGSGGATGGSSGSAGTAGSAGSSGSAGTAGSAGSSGSAGTAGSAGSSGSAGTAGSAGSSGSAGTAGSAGSSGSAGTAGSAGSSGSSGTAGAGGGCTPTTCQAEGANCGTISNGCGNTLDCGTCTSPATCGGGGVDNVCGAPMPGADTVIFTEIMKDPNALSDGEGEWFEVYNTSTTESFGLRDCVIEDDGSDTFVIGNDLYIGPQSYLTFSSGTGPGFTPDYVYSGLSLSNSSDELRLVCNTVTVDEVLYDNGATFPDTAGASLTLDPGSYDASANDDGANWCDGETSYNGDLGTPGADNDTCPCIPVTCADIGANCGAPGDGCGGTLDCGTCTDPQTCGGGGIDFVCGCTPHSCTDLGANCGAPGDGCGGTLDCGTCTDPMTCGGGGTDYVCGCTPKTCNEVGAECGAPADGCGGFLDCGTCSDPMTCGGGGTDFVCGCTPKTCNEVGAECGAPADGCGGTLDCGTCTDPMTCGGGGTDFVCGCTPKTCNEVGAECGAPADGCGGFLDCGTCSDPMTCGGGGTEFVCGCTPKTCNEVGAECGAPADSCGGFLDCGTCSDPNSCGGGGTDFVCGCTPVTCADLGATCGSPSDGCGGTLDCGSCAAPETCGGGGTDHVCGAQGVYPLPGELLINEIMYNPSGSDGDLEWVELYNTSTQALELYGCTIADGNNSPHMIDASVVIQPGGYATLASSADPGFTPSYSYEGAFGLNNSGGDTFTITCSTLIDSVEYGVSSPWPSGVDGGTISLDPDRQSPDANDLGVNWCLDATNSYGSGGNFGTPGAANLDCTTISYTIGFCNTQWPPVIDEEEGDVVDTYGRIYIAGLTDFNVNGLDPDPNVIMEFGYGDDVANVDSWTNWATASPFVGAGNDDEYRYDVTLPAPGSYHYLYRATGDGGMTWTYCDVDGYIPPDEPGDDSPGVMTTKAATAATSLFFSEYIEGSSNNKAVEIYNPTGAAVDLTGCSIQVYANGASSPNNTIDLTATVATDGTYVVCNNQSVQTIKDNCDLESGSLGFNGDDAIVLVCNAATIDAIGQVGTDPGSEWGSGDESTADNTIRRLCSIMEGDSNSGDAFDPATEWTGFPVDTFDDLGSHTTCY